MKKIYFFLLFAGFFLLLFGTASRISFADPSVLSGNPVNGTSSVFVNTRITIMFDDNITASSIGSSTGSTGTFTVYNGSATANIAGNIEVIDVGSRTVARFTPSSNLANSTQYSYKMGTGTINSYGSTSSGFAGTFTTGTSQDTSNAGIWYTSPYSNSTSIVVNTQYVYVILNERADAATVKDANFTITANSQSVSGYWAYYDYGTDYAGTPTAIFTPSGNLNYSTPYTITVATNLLDMAGNQLSQQYTSTFTTISAPSGGEEPVKPKPLQVTEVKINPNLDKIRVKFNYSLNGDYLRVIETKDCKLVDSSGNESQFGSLELSDNIVTLYLIDKMSLNTAYTLTIKGGNEGPVAAGAGGEVLAEDYILKFNTGSAENGGKGVRRKKS